MKNEVVDPHLTTKIVTSYVRHQTVGADQVSEFDHLSTPNPTSAWTACSTRFEFEAASGRYTELLVLGDVPASFGDHRSSNVNDRSASQGSDAFLVTAAFAAIFKS
jgi:hypothetical protein